MSNLPHVVKSFVIFMKYFIFWISTRRFLLWNNSLQIICVIIFIFRQLFCPLGCESLRFPLVEAGKLFTPSKDIKQNIERPQSVCVVVSKDVLQRKQILHLDHNDLSLWVQWCTILAQRVVSHSSGYIACIIWNASVIIIQYINMQHHHYQIMKISKFFST